MLGAPLPCLCLPTRLPCPQAHPFFAGVDWERLAHLPAPFVPRVEHELDTQNFEHFDEDMAGAGAGAGRANKFLAKADPNFIGYTYKNWDAVAQPDASEWPPGPCARMGSYALGCTTHTHTHTHTDGNGHAHGHAGVHACCASHTCCVRRHLALP